MPVYEQFDKPPRSARLVIQDQLTDLRTALYNVGDRINALAVTLSQHPLAEDLPKPKPKHVVGWINIRRDNSQIPPGQMPYYGALIFATEADAKAHVLTHGSANPIATVKIEFDDPGVA